MKEKDLTPTTPGAFSIEAFATRYGIGRTSVYNLMQRGELRTFSVGARRLISFEAALDWQRRAEAAAREGCASTSA